MVVLATEMEPHVSETGEYAFAYEATLHEALPGLHEAQNAWLAEIDEIEHLDRRTREMIRLVCSAAVRFEPGVERHARLATEAGAGWEQLVSALSLAAPAFGLLPVVHHLPAARRGYEAAVSGENPTDEAG